MRTLRFPRAGGTRPLVVLLPVLLAAATACADKATGPNTHATVKSGNAVLEAPVRDVAYDAKRNVLYLSEPAFFQVGVFSLGDLTYATPISTGSYRSAGLDVTPSNDTLVLALSGGPVVGVVDLRAATRKTDTLKVNTSGFMAQSPDNVRVMANGKAFFTMTFSGSGYGGNVLEVDLGKRTQLLRTDVGFGGSVTERVPLVRSADRKKMLLLIDDSCCPEDAQVYDATSNQFSSTIGTVSRYGPTVAGDSTGSRYMIGNELYSGTLTYVQTYTPLGYQGGAVVLSPDGATGYFASAGGVLVVRMTDGVVTSTLPLPEAPTRLFMLPTGAGLVAFTASRVHVFAIAR